MKKNILFISTLTIAALLTACSGGENAGAGNDEELVKTVNVTTKTVKTSDFASYVRVIGQVETPNDILISAEVNGRVVSYSVAEGEEVQKGNTIIRIDDSKLKQEKERLQAMLNQSKENYERLKKVYDEDGIGSEMDYLNAKYTYEQARSALESVKVDLANTSIKAPFTGKLESKMLEVGEMAAPGMPVVRLIGSQDYILSAGVPARYSNAVKSGDEVTLWFDTADSDTLTGIISFAGGSINPQNRTFRIEVELPSANQYKVDMIANLRLKTYEQKDVVMMSEEYVYSKGNQYVVYVLDMNEEGKPVARQRTVTLGNSYRTDVIVEEGLNVGDELITSGSAFLDDDMRVTVKGTADAEIVAN